MTLSHSLRLEPARAAHDPAAEETRLRLLALLSQSEPTVSEVVAILGQSQPRVSRHLKLLVEAGLVERRREGAWAFFRLAPGGIERAFEIFHRLLQFVRKGFQQIGIGLERTEEFIGARLAIAEQ